MSILQFKDAFVKHNPDQEEIIILGGQTELEDRELQEVADLLEINEFKTVSSQVRSGNKNGQLEYLHYALVYGSKSPFYEKANSILN